MCTKGQGVQRPSPDGQLPDRYTVLFGEETERNGKAVYRIVMTGVHPNGDAEGTFETFIDKETMLLSRIIMTAEVPEDMGPAHTLTTYDFSGYNETQVRRPEGCWMSACER